MEEKKNNLILVKRHCFSSFSSHEMLSFFIKHKFGISQLCFVLICKLLQRITDVTHVFSFLQELNLYG